MNYIEFLGPPGAGKSTIFSQLIGTRPYYGGVKDDAIEQMFYRMSSKRRRILYRLFPDVIKKPFDEKILSHWIGNQAFELFLKENPNFISIMSQAMDTVTYEPERVFTLSKKSAERYQIGLTVSGSNDILCLDEGFVHRAVSILWRCKDTTFSMDAYFNNVPTPDLVIYVDAPIDVCLKRQSDRGRVVADVDWHEKEPVKVQEKLHRVCEQVKSHIGEHTEVITIDNNRSIPEVKAEMFKKIKSI